MSNADVKREALSILKSDPFNIEKLRLQHDVLNQPAAKRVITNIRVGKPSKESFFRVHPSPDYQMTIGAIVLKEDKGTTYIVAPELASELVGESTYKFLIIRTAITRQGQVFLWTLRIPNTDGRTDLWAESELEIAKRAEENWVRMQANMVDGMYNCYEAAITLPEPQWPDEPFNTLVEKAFKGRIIDSLDHPVLKRLRGEIE